MIKVKNVKTIEVFDWDKLVSDTYGKPYSFQQQDGCQSRGIFHLTIPSEYTGDDEMNDEIPEIINGETMGVKFEKWLERDPNQPVAGRTDYGVGLWWDRNFYPDIHTVANDLHKRGLIEAGEYSIEIDW
jgi:hypothetical protein